MVTERTERTQPSASRPFSPYPLAFAQKLPALPSLGGDWLTLQTCDSGLSLNRIGARGSQTFALANVTPWSVEPGSLYLDVGAYQPPRRSYWVWG